MVGFYSRYLESSFVVVAKVFCNFQKLKCKEGLKRSTLNEGSSNWDFSMFAELSWCSNKLLHSPFRYNDGGHQDV